MNYDIILPYAIAFCSHSRLYTGCNGICGIDASIYLVWAYYISRIISLYVFKKVRLAPLDPLRLSAAGAFFKPSSC